MTDLEIVDALTKLLGDHPGPLRRGVRQENDDLVATVTDRHVVGPQPRAQQSRQAAQDLVRHGVAELVVDLFEPIDVQHDDPHRAIGARGEAELSIEGDRHVSAVEEPGERIEDRLALQLLLDPKIRQGEADSLGHHDRELLFGPHRRWVQVLDRKA